MIVNIALAIVGLGVLAWGADTFVLGAARLAVTYGLSPVVVGAVVIGFGTGAPELLVSSSAAAGDSLDIAMGNVVGSNLANLTLVLGVVGLLARPETIPRVARREAPLSLATVVLFAILLQGGLTRTEGFVLLAALVVALVVMLRSAETTTATPPAGTVESDEDRADRELIHEVEELVEEGPEEDLADVAAAPDSRDIGRAVAGLVATVAGAQLLVIGAKGIATDLGLSGGFVGLTIVAIGTSFPELVTGVQSARRNETALLAGNVLGSNVFNSTAVAGTAGIIGPASLADRGLTVLAASSMVAVAALVWLFLGRGGRLERAEAGLLLAIYAVTLPLTS